MKTVFGISRLKDTHERAVVAIGVFDGVHRGHQKIIRYVVQRALKIHGRSIVVTFDPHPLHVLNPDKYCPLVIPLGYRLKLISALGVEMVVVIPFTKKFSRLGCAEFVKRYLTNKIHPDEIVVGDDFHFGRDHHGTARMLRELGQTHGFRTTIMPTKVRGEKVISSSQIRYCLTQGDLSKAARLLRRPVSLLGQVIRGDARGRTLGYPTANIQPSRGVLLPAGVFLVNIRYHNRIFHGLANVGRRPSFRTIHNVNVEVHIFNFRKNIYGKEIVIEFIKKIRDEKVYRCQKELVRQIQADEKHARSFFKMHEK